MAKKPKLELSEPVRALAARLNERDPLVHLLLGEVVDALGPEGVAALYGEAERISVAGSELVHRRDGQPPRPRTLGGIFLRLAREKAPALWKRRARLTREIAAGRRSPPASAPATTRPTPPTTSATAPPQSTSRPLVSSARPPATDERPGPRRTVATTPTVVVKRPRTRP